MMMMIFALTTCAPLRVQCQTETTLFSFKRLLSAIGLNLRLLTTESVAPCCTQSYSLSAVPGCTQLYQDPAPLWTIEMCPEIRTNCVSGLSPLDFAAFGQSTPKELFRLKMSLQEAKRLWSTILYQLQHLTPMVSIASGHGRRDWAIWHEICILNVSAGGLQGCHGPHTGLIIIIIITIIIKGRPHMIEHSRFHGSLPLFTILSSSPRRVQTDNECTQILLPRS